MTMALVQALLLVSAHNLLHQKKLSDEPEDGKVSLFERMPSVIEMGKNSFRLIWAGFIALTIAILFGLVFQRSFSDRLFRLDHKTIVTIMAVVNFRYSPVRTPLLGWERPFCGQMDRYWVHASHALLLRC